MNLKEQKNIYFENLDSIRAIAFLLVFLWHMFGYLHYQSNSFIENNLISRVAMNGHLGVNLFFVLSGFLITYLLLIEKENTGTIHIKFFYVRRILRIWPLYFTVIVIGFFIYPLLTKGFESRTIKEHLHFYLLFIHNFDRIYSGFVGTGNDNLGVLWSIAVEEQFYLFWPIIIFFFRKKSLPYIAYTIILSSLLFRFIYLKEESIIYLHTLSVMSDLAMGSLLAYHAIYQTKSFNLLKTCKKNQILGVYLVFMIVFIFYINWSQLNGFTKIVERLVLSLFFTFVIGEQCFSQNSFIKLGKFKLLSKIGLISYGLYCLHLFSIVIVQKMNVLMEINHLNSFQFYSECILCFGISLTFAYFSYTYFESKILKLRGRFAIIKTR
jgi:peptidoglycan/LPS O-acetylase OafA/YrhL